MQMLRQRKYLFAVAALVLVFAGCKGESPTAPTSNPPTSTIGGGTPPPTTANITLTVAASSLQVNSSTTVTATVTENNQPVANGTAVEFDTTLGTFAEANAATVIRTTTNGVATVTLTSSLVGTATVSAIVANVKKTATVTFTALPTNPPPQDLAPAISGISPNFGRPQGGETVTITGKNFRPPLKVLFDFGPGTTPKEATIISATGNTIQVLTPGVDLGPTAQQLTSTVKLINEAGTPAEVVVSGPTFTFQLPILTPKITTVSPASGPIDGGTRVVIYGEGFQAPVQVFFGAAEVQAIQTLFNQITVITPTARDATPDASGTGTGSVGVRVININSATQVTLPNAFRYIPKMAITAVGPTEGPVTGGTRVRIDGTGFNDPIAVVIGGIAAQPISVSGTEIIAITGAPVVTGCSDIQGAISVTNVDNGDSATATGLNFTFRVPKPVIISATNATIGQQTTVVVFNGAPGIPRLTINDIPLTITNATTDSSTGLTTFQATVPTTASSLLHTQTCPAGGSVPIPTALTVNFANATTSCTATLPNGITLSPTPTPAVTLNPAAFSPFTSTVAKLTPPTNAAPSAPQTLNIVNTSPVQLTATSVTASPSCAGKFNLSGTPPGTVLNSCDVFQVTAQYVQDAVPETDTCTVTVLFTDPISAATITKTLILNGTAQ